MPIFAKAGPTFTPAPAGLHQGVCVDVVDLGVLEVTYAGQTKRQHKIRLAWQIEETDDAGKRFIVGKRYTCSLHEKSALRKDLESWRGRAFSFDELAGFDLEKLLGANAQINIQHATKDGSTYANVVGIVPLGKGMTRMDAKGYVRAKDREPSDEQATEETPQLTDDDIPF